MEEYSIAKQIYRLSQADTCEIARNSVLQSGYSDEEKAHWLGSLDRWKNEILKTNVPNIRVKFRHKTWLEEWLVLRGESEVMDSLIQFATQHLLSSPTNRQSAVAPKLPAIDGLPPSRIDEAEDRLNSRKSSFLLNRRRPIQAGTVPLWLSGVVVGAILALALLDIKTRRK